MLPLRGLTVVALEQAVAAPYCTSRLADAGARVIKVERPLVGDFARDYDRVVRGESAYFVWLNRGKESIALDIKAPEDAGFLTRLIANADVFVQNLAPNAAARAGFGSSMLRQSHPSLITCTISGYSEGGPYSNDKAYDLLIQAESGLASVTGRPEGPGRVGVSVCDIAAGMYAYMGIMEAIIERSVTGQGSEISISLFDAMADWMTVPLLHYVYGGKAPDRVGLNHPSIAPYGAYPTADGHFIVLAVQNQREWARFCEEILGRLELTKDERFVDNSARVANRQELDRLVISATLDLTRDQAIAKLRSSDIAQAAVNSVADLALHPMLRPCAVGTASGPVNLVASPIMRNHDNAHQFLPVPRLDEHGPALRAEFSS